MRRGNRRKGWPTAAEQSRARFERRLAKAQEDGDEELAAALVEMGR